jgi:transcriptional regulator with XRE-family HTH domain
MTASNGDPITGLPGFGPRLRRLRRQRGLKQGHVAEIAGVCQTTVSRWEAGQIEPAPALAAAVLQRLTRGLPQDRALRRLVESSSQIVHLVTDIDHRLLAASPAREADWAAKAAPYLGQSLWRFATAAIVRAEQSLTDLGWWETQAPAPVRVEISDGRVDEIRIRPGLMLWERLWLADGTPARLCTMLP